MPERPVLTRWTNLFVLAAIPLLFRDQLRLPLLPIIVLTILALNPVGALFEAAIEELAELLGIFIGGLLHSTMVHVDDLAVFLTVLLTLPGTAASNTVENTITGIFLVNLVVAIGCALFASSRSHTAGAPLGKDSSPYVVMLLVAIGLTCLPTAVHFLFHGQFDAFSVPVIGRVSIGVPLVIVQIGGWIGYIAFFVFHLRPSDEIARVHRTVRRAQSREKKREVAPVGTVDVTALFVEERAAAQEHIRTGAVVSTAARPRKSSTADSDLGIMAFFAQHALLRGLVANVILALGVAGLVWLAPLLNTSVDTFFHTQSAVRSFGVAFGLIVLPLISSLDNISASIGLARKGRGEIASAVAAGACTQFLMFIVPIAGIVGIVTGRPLSLIFHPFDLVILLLTLLLYVVAIRARRMQRTIALALLASWVVIALIALLAPPL